MAELILGIEIGGTKLQIALGTPDGTVIAVRQGFVEVNSGGEGIRRWLMERIPEFLSQENVPISQVAAMGCGFGGPIDRNAGKTLVSNQITGWHDFPLRDWLETTFKLHTWVENDSNAAAWGEYLLGFGRGIQHFFYTNLGSGVGGGLILNGTLYDGQGYGAGEFGHTYVPNLFEPGPCAPVKIEHVCSGWSIEARLRQPGYVPEGSHLYQNKDSGLANVTTYDLAKAANNGDKFALAEIERVAHTLGIGLANVLSLTNVERIAIGGGVSNLGDLLIEPVRYYTEKYAFISSQGRYQIQQSQLGELIVLIGAIQLARQLIETKPG